MRVYQIKVLNEAQHSSALIEVTVKAWSSTLSFQPDHTQRKMDTNST